MFQMKDESAPERAGISLTRTPAGRTLRSALPLVVTGLSLALAACAPADAPDAATDMPRALGPVDGFELPGAAPERVKVGDMAPDFALESYRGDTLALTDYRGTHEVILVFYRGSW